MKTPLLVLVWLFLAQLTMAQNDVGKQAETAYQNKQFDKAATLFLQAQDYYNAACSFALGGKKKEALHSRNGFLSILSLVFMCNTKANT